MSQAKLSHLRLRVHLFEGQKHLKPQRMAGSLLGLQTLQVLQLQPLGLSRVDTGEEGVEGYPQSSPDLCQAYAKHAIAHFKKVGEQEFLAEKLEASKKEVELPLQSLQKQWLLEKSFC